MSTVPSPANPWSREHDATERQHVRRPSVPWREADLTECGRTIGDARVLTRAEFLARLKDQGPTRSALTTCMTCWETASRYPSWEEDPVSALMREATNNQPHWGPGRLGARLRTRFGFELLAIADLIAAHRSEFDALVEDYSSVVPIDKKARTA